MTEIPDHMPWKMTAQTVGFQRAYRNFIDFYGYTEGNRIFWQKADEQGSGNTIRQKANSIYKKGAKLK